jgi:hypothetical protein
MHAGPRFEPLNEVVFVEQAVHERHEAYVVQVLP